MEHVVAFASLTTREADVVVGLLLGQLKLCVVRVEGYGESVIRLEREGYIPYDPWDQPNG